MYNLQCTSTSHYTKFSSWHAGSTFRSNIGFYLKNCSLKIFTLSDSQTPLVKGATAINALRWLGEDFLYKKYFEDWKIVRARYNPFLAEFFHQPLFSWSVATLGTVNNNAITFTFDRFLHHLLVLTFLHHLLLFTFLHNL